MKRFKSPELLRARGKCDESEQRPTTQLKKIAVEPESLCDQHQDKDKNESESWSWTLELCGQSSVSGV